MKSFLQTKNHILKETGSKLLLILNQIKLQVYKLDTYTSLTIKSMTKQGETFCKLVVLLTYLKNNPIT